MSCRICLDEEGPFIHPCACKGTSAYVHEACLVQWAQNNRTRCEICRETYSRSKKCSFTPVRYCIGCFECQMPGQTLVLLVAFCVLLFMFAILMFIFVDTRNWFVVDTGFSVTVVVLTLVIQLLEPKDVYVYNAMVLFKISVSVSYLTVYINTWLEANDKCTMRCTMHDDDCLPSCPAYSSYSVDMVVPNNVLLFDISNIVFFLLLRGVAQCFVNMGSIAFSNAVDRTEREPLLEEVVVSAGVA